MSTLRNNVRLIGRVGNNPETKTFENGNKVVSCSLATNEVYYNDKNEKVETTQWHNLVAWGKTADIFDKYVEKGKEDRKSTRLNSSHVRISYAVFCLKKKKIKIKSNSPLNK